MEDESTTETHLLIGGDDKVRIGTYQEGYEIQKLNIDGAYDANQRWVLKLLQLVSSMAHVFTTERPRLVMMPCVAFCYTLTVMQLTAGRGLTAHSARLFNTSSLRKGSRLTASVKKFGEGAALFDGASYLIVDQMLGSRGEFFPGAAGFTLTAWLNLDSLGTIQPLWGVGGTAADWQNITYNQSTDTLACYENTGVGKTLNWAVPSIGLSHSTWHYLMIAYESAGGGKVFVFVDGTLMNVGGTSMANTWIGMFSTGAINIGYDKYDSGLYFKGHIDEFSYSATARQTADFVSPSEPFYAEGLYCYHAGRSAPYRLKPTGS